MKPPHFIMGFCRYSVWILLVTPLLVELFYPNTILFGCSVALSVAIIVYFCEWIPLYLHSRPLYYEDLENDLAIQDRARKKFQVYFLRLQQIILVASVTLTALYYRDRYQHEEFHLWIFISAIGGFNAFVAQILDPLGKILLQLVNTYRLASPLHSSQHSDINGIPELSV